MSNNPYNAYQKQQSAQEDARLTEARALMRCASLMEEAQKPEVDYLFYSDVLLQNQKLWTLFQAALAENLTELPPQLKSVLKGLSIYVDRRTMKALPKQNPRMLNVLININKEIAAGLVESVKKDTSAQAQAQASMPPPSTQGSSGSISGQF
jgi:flagellar protein FlaF